MKLALRVVAFLLLVVVVGGVIFYRYPLWVTDQHTRFHLWRRGVKRGPGMGLRWCWCMDWGRGVRIGAR